MKKCLSLVLCLVLTLGIIGCGGGGAASAGTWQEQYDLGIRYLADGNYQEAVLAFEAAIRIDPKRADAYISLAETYSASGNAEKAEEILRQAVDVCGETEELTELLTRLGGSTSGSESGNGESGGGTSGGNALYDVTPDGKMVFYSGKMAGLVTRDEQPAYLLGTEAQLADHLQLQGPNPGNVTYVGSTPYTMRQASYTSVLSDNETGQVWAIYGVEPAALMDIQFDYGWDESYGGGLPIGFREICMGDTYAAVVEKLGLPAEVTEYMEIDFSVRKDETYGSARRDTDHTYNGEPCAIVSIRFSNDDGTIGWQLQLDFPNGKLAQAGWMNYLKHALKNGN